MSIDEEVRRLDEEIARLKQQNQEQREQIRDMGATDQTEIAALITQIEEQEAVIAELEERRASLVRQPGGQ
jgi:predicted  nucleic acid-binding Zn-ribbon protein